MSTERAWPAFVEDEDENGQAIPGTRRYAQAPSVAPVSPTDQNINKPRQEYLSPLNIAAAQAYNRVDSMAGYPSHKDIMYQQTSAAEESRPEYMPPPPPPPPPPHTATPYRHPPEYYFAPASGSYPMPSFFPPASPSYPSYSSYPAHYSLYNPPRHPSYPPFLPPPPLPPPPQYQFYVPAPHPPSAPPPLSPPPPLPHQFYHPPPSPLRGGYSDLSLEYGYPPVRSVSRNASRPLASRFQLPEACWDRASDPITRSTSAFGSRDVLRPRSRTMERAGYPAAERKAEVRGSTHLSRRSQEQMESAPATHLNTQRRSGDGYHGSYDVEDFKSNVTSGVRSRRPSVTFDLPPRMEKGRLEPSANGGRRRDSWYDPLMPTNSYVTKLNQASSYLEAVMGPEALDPLGAEISRRAKRPEVKSRGSQSRDGSDVKKSDTTRSGSPNDNQNMTIKVLAGTARVTLGGAQIDCAEGGAIEIKRDRSSRTNSERHSPEYGSSRQSNEDQRPWSRRSEKRADRHREKPHSYREMSRDRGYDGLHLGR